MLKINMFFKSYLSVPHVPYEFAYVLNKKKNKNLVYDYVFDPQTYTFFTHREP